MADTLIPVDNPLIWINPNRVSGAPCFFGTRVPVKSLLDHLDAGDPLSVFLEDFPDVSEMQAKALLHFVFDGVTQPRTTATAAE